MFADIPIKLLFEPSADSVHNTVMCAYWHTIGVIFQKLSLTLGCLTNRQGVQLGYCHLEFTQCIALRVLNVCIVLLHQGRVDIAHKVRLLICHDAAIHLSLCGVFNLIRSMTVVPLSRHRLTNNAFSLVDGVLLIKLTTLNTVCQYLILLGGSRETSSNIKHTGYPVSGLTDVVAEALYIGTNEVRFGRDSLVSSTLCTHKSRQRLQLLDKSLVIRQHNEVTIAVHSVEGVRSGIPVVKDGTGRHISIPIVGFIITHGGY